MKKLVLWFFVAVMTLSLFALVACDKTDDRDGAQGVVYALNDDQQSYYVSSGSNANSKNIVILSAYNGLPVTGIGDEAFRGCSDVVSITIPESVTSIGENAFQDCIGLTNVYYGGTIADWCKITFNGLFSSPMFCASHFYMKNNDSWKEVTEIEIPENVTEIGDNQFSYFRNVKSVTIPSSVTIIGSYAFDSCDSLQTVTFEGDSQLQSIGDGAFRRCISLQTFTFEGESQLQSIGDGAFHTCASLTEITIPISVTSIGDGAFSYCNRLTNVYYGGTIVDWCKISFEGFASDGSNPLQ